MLYTTKQTEQLIEAARTVIDHYTDPDIDGTDDEALYNSIEELKQVVDEILDGPNNNHMFHADRDKDE